MSNAVLDTWQHCSLSFMYFSMMGFQLMAFSRKVLWLSEDVESGRRRPAPVVAEATNRGGRKFLDN